MRVFSRFGSVVFVSTMLIGTGLIGTGLIGTGLIGTGSLFGQDGDSTDGQGSGDRGTAGNTSKAGAAEKPVVPTSMVEQLQDLTDSVRMLALRTKSLEETTSADIAQSLKQLVQRLDDLERQLDRLAQRQDAEQSVLSGGDKNGMIRVDGGDSTRSESPDRTVLRKPVLVGTLFVDNQTDAWQTLQVNGTPWQFPPGKSNMQVAYGKVTTHLVAFEEKREWDTAKWTEKDGEPRLEIAIGFPSPST